MTLKNSGDRSANPAEKATAALASSFEEFQGAMTRFIFPPEGYAHADVIGLTTNLQVASLRFWLAAVQAPVQMIAGVDLPQAPVELAPATQHNAFTVAAPVPAVVEPVAAPAKPSTGNKPKPRTTSAVPKLLGSTALANASSAQVMPFRRSEPADIAILADPVSARQTAEEFIAPEQGALTSKKPADAAFQLAATAVKSAREPASASLTPADVMNLVDAIDPAGDFDDADVTAREPAFLPAPNGMGDDLLLIKGIGPKLNQLLHDLGIWHYKQIAGWTPEEIAWINAKLDFQGRVQRERWVLQSRELASKSAT
jgi:predicted flap endonuclease-1-like 5' DNA nuclease